jgi:hypothetical protein
MSAFCHDVKADGDFIVDQFIAEVREEIWEGARSEFDIVF